ncbi:MAG: T9SS type A sorting domain-containing protein [Bacteroidales bacterium]|nr:T9SS type A sorting domain-containing protein [Bacteroidales bacterium]MDT8430172.1 T9SS type A sorting domain-containing protein [Bacteroidales bacterium]
MKKNYMNGRRSVLKTALLIFLTGLMSLTAAAQETLVWNGSVDSDATNPLNWTPNGSVFNNILSVDSAFKFTNQPVLTLTGANDPINRIDGVATTDFTIVNAGDFLDINTSGSSYWNGILTLQAGALSYRKNLYLEEPTSIINVEGGSLETRSYLLMGKKDGSSGGYLNISGTGKVHCRVEPGRFAADSLMSVITITEDGILEVRGDWVASANTLIARNQITSDINFDPFAYYDADNALTIVDLRSKDELFLADLNTIQVLVDETVPDVEAVHNRGFMNLVSREWKYTTSVDGPLVSFDPAQTGEALTGVSFSDPGIYWVVLEGNTGSGTILSDTVQVSVTSPMVTLDPVAEQTIRLGYAGGMISASFLETPTSVEWKYATTSGGPYVSFDPAVTVDEYIPDFDAIGAYYVICEAVVNSATYVSPEVPVSIVDTHAPAQSIEWTGAYNNDAADPRNWNPIMVPWFNNLNILSRESNVNPPTLSTAGNDTINTLYCADSVNFIINKAALDTVYIPGGGVYQGGKIIIENGVVLMKGLGRLDQNNAGFILKNDAQLHMIGSLGFIVGTGTDGARGGSVRMMDNAYLYVASEGDGIWRWAADSTLSRFTLSENARIEIAGDHTGDIAYRVQREQIIAVEGFVVEYEYNATENLTVITVKNLVSFDISPLDAQYVGVGLSMDELTTINTEGITSQEWKYATQSGGTYVSFDPAQTGTTLTASFDAAGTYYVVCEGSDGTDTYVSDEAIVNVVSVEITPAETQELLEYEEGALLTVTENIAPDSREWKSSTTSGSGYASFSPARLSDTYRPFFAAEGTYFVVCESVYGGKGILSNEVEVIVSKEDVGIENSQSIGLSVYPNPAEGAFYLDVENGGSFTVEIFDITGKRVFNKSYVNVNGPQEMNLASEGLHMIKITREGVVRTEKIVVR